MGRLTENNDASFAAAVDAAAVDQKKGEFLLWC